MIELSVLGRTLCASHLEPQWERWLYTHWQYPEGPLEPSGLRITLEQRDHSPALGGGDWQPLELTGHTVTARLEAERVTLKEASGGAQLNVGHSRGGQNADVMIEFWGQSPALGAMLHALLSEALRVSGLLSLHASAAVQRGVVTAFLGVGGAGKTTTLLRAWCADWEPLCEDLFWLEPKSLTAHGWDRGLRLLPDTVERFSPLLPSSVRGHQLDKWFVPYAQLGCEPRSATLARVALLERGDSGSTVWTAASRRETALALWQATGLPLTKVAQGTVSSAIAALTDRLERRRLILGRHDFSPLPDSETR